MIALFLRICSQTCKVYAGRVSGYIAILILLFVINVAAHDISNVDEFFVRQTNDKISRLAVQLQDQFSGGSIREEAAEQWPPAGLTRQLNELVHLKEDSDLCIEFFIGMGINVYTYDELDNNPVVEQSVLANNLVFAGIRLTELAMIQPGREEFINTIQTNERLSYLYNILLDYDPPATHGALAVSTNKHDLVWLFGLALLLSCVILVYIVFVIRSDENSIGAG